MQFTVTPDKDGMMLSRLLLQLADVPQWAVKQALKNRDVRVDGVRVTSDVRVREGQQIRAYWPKEAVTSRGQSKPGLPIVFENEHVILINKPQGLQAQNDENPLSGDSALTRVIAMKREAGEKTDSIRLCHRLDVQTGGLLLLTKDDAAYEAARKAFEARTMEKFYTCRVKGCPARKEAGHARVSAQGCRTVARFSHDYPARGALEIVTGYRVMEPGEYARLEVELMTGRTHQIRAHLAHIGHPILGDDKYGDRALNRQLGLRRQQLWATRLVFHADGVLAELDGQTFTVKCPF